MIFNAFAQTFTYSKTIFHNVLLKKVGAVTY